MISIRSSKGAASERVGRGHEHHVGQVVVDLKIVIDEVLFCSGSSTSSKAEPGSPRQSLPILSISSSRNSGFDVLAFFMRLNDLAGHRADISPAVAANLGFVTHAAQRHRARNSRPVASAIGFAQARFCRHAGGPTRHRIGPFSLRTLLHRKVFDDPLLDLFQTVVIRHQDPRPLQISS